MKFQQIFILLFFVFGNIYAQKNLIYNSDFEKYKALPTDIGQGKNCLDGWTIPVLIGGGDYYHADSKSKKARTSKNYFGKQEPHSGKAYAGICITKTYREYLQTELMQVLQKNKKYKIELYINCGDAVWLGNMKELCILFTSKQTTILKDETLLVKPSIVFKKEEGYKNSDDWEKLETIYEADGTEKYLTFGSFVYRERNESEVKTYNLDIPGKANYAHYYIDDFTLTEINSEQVVEQEVPQDETPKIYETGKAHIFKNIVFETGKADLLPSSFDELNELAEYLKDNPDLKANIIGHTDNVGKKEDNLTLSKNRAQTVLNFLKNKNINSSRLFSEGKGDLAPISTNDTPEGKQKNRRVEVVFFN